MKIKIFLLLFSCCNTCDDIQNAYRMKGWAVPNLDTFEQCKREGWSKKLQSVDKEGCQVFGYLDVNRVRYCLTFPFHKSAFNGYKIFSFCTYKYTVLSGFP